MSLCYMILERIASTTCAINVVILIVATTTTNLVVLYVHVLSVSYKNQIKSFVAYL